MKIQKKTKTTKSVKCWNNDCLREEINYLSEPVRDRSTKHIYFLLHHTLPVLCVVCSVVLPWRWSLFCICSFADRSLYSWSPAESFILHKKLSFCSSKLHSFSNNATDFYVSFPSTLSSFVFLSHPSFPPPGPFPLLFFCKPVLGCLMVFACKK